MTATAIAAIAGCRSHGTAIRLDYADYVRLARTGGAANLYCLAGHLLSWTVIEGRRGTGRCDARCWDSLRSSCTCSCGGHQHATTFGVFESGR